MRKPSKYGIKLVASPYRLSARTNDILSRLDRSIFGLCAPPANLKNKYWWLAFEDGEAVAYAGMYHHGTSCGFLYRIGVSPQARGNGLQVRLVRAMDTAARRLGWGKNITYTSAVNVISANNMISCGYKLYNPEEEDPGWLWWYKDLRQLTDSSEDC